MKIRIAQEELLKALQQFHSVAGRKSTMPILSNILLEAKNNAITVFATDLEIGIRGTFAADVQEEGAVTLSCRHLMDIVRELPPADITMGSLDNNWVSITCGKSDFKIAGLSAEEFPSWPEFDTSQMVDIDGAMLGDMIRKTIYCVAENETRYVLNGACFKITASEDGTTSAEMVGTDGHRLALVKKNVPAVTATGGPAVIIPKKGLIELRKMLEDGHAENTVSFSLGKNQVLFRKGSVELFARLIEGNYPNYNQVIPSRNDKKLTIPDKKVFTGAIKRVSVLAKDKISAVRMDIAPDKVTLVVNNPELGEAVEEMSAAYSATEPLSIAFNARYVLDALQVLEGDEVTISLADPVSPSIITQPGDADYLAVIMPLRI